MVPMYVYVVSLNSTKQRDAGKIRSVTQTQKYIEAREGEEEGRGGHYAMWRIVDVLCGLQLHRYNIQYSICCILYTYGYGTDWTKLKLNANTFAFECCSTSE